MKFYQSKLLNSFANLTHCFTTKQSKNLAFHVEDNGNDVLANHQKLANKLAYDLQKLVHMKQIHSNLVKIVNANDNFTNPPTCDALITDKKETPLIVMVADCSPILFYDPKKEIIAVAHAGRAGAFDNIVKNVIESFVHDFNSNPADILASVGPAICQKCYEVGEEIAQEAEQKNYGYALEQKGNKYFLNIRSILKKQLRENGLNTVHIEIATECSKCDKRFYSYRENKSCGRFAGVL
ncbi:MAG: peptidoglycan editing factor PgeF, partial [Epsilonproteobacteria bacterium]|nr:peptidoglycan editing factor PgeF [Campylobacterota bacterium]